MPVQVEDIIPEEAAQEEAPPQEEAQEEAPQEEAPLGAQAQRQAPRQQEQAEAACGGSARHRGGAKGKAEAKAPRGACAHEARRQQKGGDTGGVGE